MARSSTIKTETPDTAVQTEVQAEGQSTEESAAVTGQAEEQSAPETQTAPAPTPEPTPEKKETLFSLSELAEKHRLPSWHSAALHTMMGWQEGKLVREAAFAKALDSLKNRRCGG